MATWLRQSTAVDIQIGPFLDDTDGKTPETGLSLTQPDVRLTKNGAAWAQKSAAQTLAHSENGYYSVNLSTTDTGTLGRLKLHVSESGALPVWMEFMVVPGQVYDSMVLGTDLLDTEPNPAAIPTTAAITTAIGAMVIETGLTLTNALRIIAAVVAGKLSGAGTGTEVFRNPVADNKNRVTSTIDTSKNRTAVTYDLS